MNAPQPAYQNQYSDVKGPDGVPAQSIPMSPPGYPAGQPAQLPNNMYNNARPIQTLTRYPEVVDCPACQMRGITRVVHRTGDFTHLSAVVACLIACLPCVPYLMNTFKDAQHYCSNCNTLLATNHRSGGTEVHLWQ